MTVRMDMMKVARVKDLVQDDNGGKHLSIQ